MPKDFILTGDIRHPGKIKVTAETLEEALKKADDGDFVVYDEMNKCLAFDWNGDESTVETEVCCKFCHKQAPADTAHLHDGGWVGDDCCWDERLRATE